jgi:hypothetical protein
MAPAAGLDDRRRSASGLIELVISGIGVGMHNTGPALQMLSWMLAAAVRRLEIQSRRRCTALERPVIADIVV